MTRRSLRGLGIPRNEHQPVPEAGAWRCPEHGGRLHLPGQTEPGCGCASPWSRLALQDDEELRRFRSPDWQHEEMVRRRQAPPGRRRGYDYDVLAIAPGTCKQVALQHGCSPELVSRARRLSA